MARIHTVVVVRAQETELRVDGAIQRAQQFKYSYF